MAKRPIALFQPTHRADLLVSYHVYFATKRNAIHFIFFGGKAVTLRTAAAK